MRTMPSASARRMSSKGARGGRGGGFDLRSFIAADNLINDSFATSSSGNGGTCGILIVAGLGVFVIERCMFFSPL